MKAWDVVNIVLLVEAAQFFLGALAVGVVLFLLHLANKP